MKTTQVQVGRPTRPTHDLPRPMSPSPWTLKALWRYDQPPLPPRRPTPLDPGKPPSSPSSCLPCLHCLLPHIQGSCLRRLLAQALLRQHSSSSRTTTSSIAKSPSALPRRRKCAALPLLLFLLLLPLLPPLPLDASAMPLPLPPPPLLPAGPLPRPSLGRMWRLHLHLLHLLARSAVDSEQAPTSASTRESSMSAPTGATSSPRIGSTL